MILLDTNIVIAVMNNWDTAIEAAFKERHDSGLDLVVSSIVLFELRFAIARSTRPRENAEALSAFLDAIRGVVECDAEDAAVAGSVRAALDAAGTPIGPYDVLIGGQALRHGATLVTRNVREFSRVPDLKVEDWAGQ